MAHSVMASTDDRSSEPSEQNRHERLAPAKAEALIGALDDEDCRAILDATATEPLSAKELSETCDVALSTTYRKLDQLIEGGLLEEQTVVRHSMKHTSEYAPLVESVVISLDTQGEIGLQVSRRERADQRESPQLTVGE
jgi:DNA-binding transcriptional ArsR family regulator